MPRTPGLTKAEIEERWDRIAGRLRGGVDPRTIARDEGVSLATVYRIRLKLEGARQTNRAFTDDEIARIEQLLDDGASLREVARTVGRDPKVISRRWVGRGWTREQVGDWLSMRWALPNL